MDQWDISAVTIHDTDESCDQIRTSYGLIGLFTKYYVSDHMITNFVYSLEHWGR